MIKDSDKNNINNNRPEIYKTNLIIQNINNINLNSEKNIII